VSTLAILGASGHGKVIADLAETLGWENIKFFDDAWPAKTQLEEWEVSGDTEVLLSSVGQFDGIVVAIGNNRVRLEKYKCLSEAGATLVKLVHHSSVVSSKSCLGKGSVVMAGAVINAFSSVGDACIVNTGATIDHDCVLADGCHVSPGANLAGSVSLGEGAWVGIGANVRQNITIARHAVVGAGATVVKDVANNEVVVGCPAKPIREG